MGDGAEGCRVAEDARWAGAPPGRSGQGRRKALDAGSVGPISVEILGVGLCPTMGIEGLT